MKDLLNTKEYIGFLNQIKQDVYTARVRASMAVNHELILLCWRIGQEILKCKRELVWGSEVVHHLSRDLKYEFPEMKGFSARNLVYMQTFASASPDYEFTQQVAGQIVNPWE